MLRNLFIVFLLPTMLLVDPEVSIFQYTSDCVDLRSRICGRGTYFDFGPVKFTYFCLYILYLLFIY